MTPILTGWVLILGQGRRACVTSRTGGNAQGVRQLRDIALFNDQRQVGGHVLFGLEHFRQISRIDLPVNLHPPSFVATEAASELGDLSDGGHG